MLTDLHNHAKFEHKFGEYDEVLANMAIIWDPSISQLQCCAILDWDTIFVWQISRAFRNDSSFHWYIYYSRGVYNTSERQFFSILIISLIFLKRVADI